MIVEDGSLVAGADSYVSLAFAATYMPTTAYAAAWLGLTDGVRENLLIRATRALDALVVWKGYPVTSTQGVQWPRQNVPPVVAPGDINWLTENSYYPSNTVPLQVKQAACEYAGMNINADRLADVQGAGLHSVSVGKGAVAIEFNNETAPGALGRLIPGLLAPFTDGVGGTPGGFRGSISTVRV